MATRTAIAMSGGGHRACVFALGALLYLADAGRLSQISSASSVSGGSFAHGVVAQDLDLATCSPGDAEQTVRRVARRVAHGGTVLAAPITIVYLVALAVLLAAVLAGPWLLPIAVGFRVLVFVAGLVVLGWFAALRGWVTAAALGHTLFTHD